MKNIFTERPSYVQQTEIEDQLAYPLKLNETYVEQLVTNLPTENTGVVFLVLFNSLLYFRSSDSGFRPTDGSWSDGTRFLVTLLKEMITVNRRKLMMTFKSSKQGLFNFFMSQNCVQKEQTEKRKKFFIPPAEFWRRIRGTLAVDGR